MSVDEPRIRDYSAACAAGHCWVCTGYTRAGTPCYCEHHEEAPPEKKQELLDALEHNRALVVADGYPDGFRFRFNYRVVQLAACRERGRVFLAGLGGGGIGRAWTESEEIGDDVPEAPNFVDDFGFDGWGNQHPQ